MVLFSPRNGLNRTAKRAISQRRMNFFGLRYRVYKRAAQPETGFITPDLTSIHISFTKIFCQNKVKKNCNSFSGFSLKDTDIGCGKKAVNIST